MGRDRFRYAARRDHDEVRAAARGEAVVGEAECRGSLVGDHRGRVAQFPVAHQVTLEADDGGAFEHVGGAVGPPGVTDVVRAGEDADAVLAQTQHGRHGVAGAVRHDRHPGRGQGSGGAVEFGGVDLPEGVGVADGDGAVEAERRRALRNVPQLPGAGHASVVQMDVDARAMALGQAEDDVELAVHVSVEARRIEAADQVGALRECRVEEVGDAGRGDHAALRERDDLDPQPVAELLPHLDQLAQAVQAHVRVDVDVRPHMAGTKGHHAVRQGRGAVGHRYAGGDAQGPFVRDVRAAWPRWVRLPGRAEQCLVQVSVPVDERGQDESAPRSMLPGPAAGPRPVSARSGWSALSGWSTKAVTRPSARWMSARRPSGSVAFLRTSGASGIDGVSAGCDTTSSNCSFGARHD